MSMKQLVKKLPFPIRQSLRHLYRAIPLRIRYGRAFWNTYNFIQESQWWSKEKLEEYQIEQLQKLLNHTYENVPYYRRVFDERDIKPKDIRSIDDLQKLPYLTKDIIRKEFNNLLAKNMPKSILTSVRTSGSTGTPLVFYQQRGVADSIELAFIWRMWRWSGYQFGDRCVILREEAPDRLEGGKKAWWEWNPVYNYLVLSPHHMTEENLYKYVERIREFKPKVIQAIPSIIFILSDFMQRHRIVPFSSIKVILCSSETLYPWQREKIENAFDCRIFNFYGQTEHVVLAGPCERRNEYHIFPEYGITEIIGRDDKHVTREGEMGEIVGTGFNNYAMPFIRYKTKDVAVWTNRRCDCGREYRLLKRVEGRLQDFVVSKTGYLIPLTTIPYSFVNNVRQFQFYQEAPGEVTLRIVRMLTYTEKDSEHILGTLQEEIGCSLKFSIEFVDDIARTKGEKYLYLIQKLSIKVGYEMRKGFENDE